MPDEISDEVRVAVKDGAERVLFEMKARAPYDEESWLWSVKGRPRKHLRDQLEAKIAKNGLSARIGLLGKRVASEFFFWRYLEFGTKKMEKRPFAFPAWRSVREHVRRGVREATVSALRRVAGERGPDA